MRFVFLLNLILLSLVLAGCATTAPQTKTLLERRPDNIPVSTQLKEVPFIEQDAGQCGPATLAMAMQWAGQEVSVEQLIPKVMTASKDGSLPENMIGAARREGMYAVKISGMENVFQEVAAGHPVIVFENLGLGWMPFWHYALVVGFDFNSKEVILHSGPTAHERIDFGVFERSWKHSDYWGLVVLNPGTLAVSANEIENLRAAAGLEQVDRLDEAAWSYEAILDRWPTSLGALIGLGNIAFAQKDYDRSLMYLQLAREHHPNSKTVLNNLRVAEKKAEESPGKAPGTFSD